MQYKDFDNLSSMTVKVPDSLKKDFRKAIAYSDFNNIHEAIASYMIKTVGEYNRNIRQASKSA